MPSFQRPRLSISSLLPLFPEVLSDSRVSSVPISCTRVCTRPSRVGLLIPGHPTAQVAIQVGDANISLTGKCILMIKALIFSFGGEVEDTGDVFTGDYNIQDVSCARFSRNTHFPLTRAPLSSRVLLADTAWYQRKSALPSVVHVQKGVLPASSAFFLPSLSLCAQAESGRQVPLGPSTLQASAQLSPQCFWRPRMPIQF